MGSKARIFIIILISAAVIAGAAFIVYPRLSVPDSLKTGSFKTVTVGKGQVVSSIKATGVVESESEVLILSPSSSIIKRIYKEPGTKVDNGELILQLDTEGVKHSIESITDQLEVKRNSLDKTRLSAKSTRLDLEYNEEVKKLKITSLKSTLADQKQLLEVGGISPAKVEKTKQEITLAEKDLQTLTEKNSIRLKQLVADEKGLLLQIRIQEKELQEKKELLGKLGITAPSSGIVLSVAGNEGEKVGADKTLVKMSDLSSFKVIGSVEEQFAKQIKTGGRVYVTVDNEKLEGRIGIITPVVANEKVQFNVHLKQKNHPKLIANQNVVIQIISHVVTDAVRIKKWPDFKNKKRQNLFVIEGNKAVKRNITLGTIGNEYLEILSGVEEGDKVIVSEINQYKNLNEIEIQN